MTCVASSTFRLLDERVGWDPRTPDGLSGLTLAGGALRLSSGPQARAAGPRPARAARLDVRELHMVARAPSTAILRLGPCDDAFTPWLDIGPVRALAARGSLLVAATNDAVLVFDGPGTRLVGQAEPGRRHAPSASAPAAPCSPATTPGSCTSSTSAGCCAAALSTGAPIARLAHPPAGPCRTLVVHDDATLSVVDGATRHTRRPLRAATSSRADGVTAATALGFCLEQRGCFDWDGGALDPRRRPRARARPLRDRAASTSPSRSTAGSRAAAGTACASTPTSRASTTLEIASRRPTGPPRDAARSSRRRARGAPSRPATRTPTTGSRRAAGVVDVPIRAPAGRYAYVRVRLTGDGYAHAGRAPDPARPAAPHEPRRAAGRLLRGYRRARLLRALPVAVRRAARGGRRGRSRAATRCSTPRRCPTTRSAGSPACSGSASRPRCRSRSGAR